MLREYTPGSIRNVVTAPGYRLDLVPARQWASEVASTQKIGITTCRGTANKPWIQDSSLPTMPVLHGVLFSLPQNYPHTALSSLHWKGYSIMYPSQCIIPTRTTASVNSAPGLDLPLHIPAFVYTVSLKMVYPDDSNSEKEIS
jgi:hypothetical protein